MEWLGVHITRAAVRAVLVDDEGQVRASASAPGPDLPSVLDVVGEALGGRRVGGTGVAVDHPDLFGARSAIGELPPAGLARAVPAPAAAVAAETWIGAASGFRHVTCLWIADEVLAGVLIDGTLWNGAHGMAGAAGWMALNPVERQDYRQYGSLAAEIGNGGVARRLVWRVRTGEKSAAVARAGSVDAVTAAHVYAAAQIGDAVAVSVVRETAKYVGMAAATLAALLDPEVVVIAGLPASAGDLLFQAAKQEAARRLPPQMAPSFRCELSPLGEDGVAIGAARLAASPQA